MQTYSVFVSLNMGTSRDMWLGLTSPVQLLTGDYIAQNVSVGFTRFFPAELQRIRAQRCEHQGSRRTGSAQSERRAFKERAQ